jgi:hypothetical protein
LDSVHLLQLGELGLWGVNDAHGKLEFHAIALAAATILTTQQRLTNPLH